MARGWNRAFEGNTPDNTREVIMASSERENTFSAQYVASQNTWYFANTNDVVGSPLLWRDFPANPIINE